MKIVACLSWFDEPLPFLDRLVRSLAGVTDELVALDGRWYGHDAPSAVSSRAERDTIRSAAAEIGLPARIVVPRKAWESQIEKRDRLFGLAATRQADWLLVVDGDIVVSRCDPAALRRSLELTGLDVAEVAVTQLNQVWPLSEVPPSTMPERHLYRCLDGLTVEGCHYGVRAGSKWLNGDSAYVNLETALDLSRVIAFDHDNGNRPPDRAKAARDYRKTRQTEGLESWR